MLQTSDVYVCDHFGMKEDGPSIGDNVGNAIYARSGNGIVYDGASVISTVLKELDGLTDDLYQSDSRVARKGGARQWRVFEALPWPDY